MGDTAKRRMGRGTWWGEAPVLPETFNEAPDVFDSNATLDRARAEPSVGVASILVAGEMVPYLGEPRISFLATRYPRLGKQIGLARR